MERVSLPLKEFNSILAELGIMMVSGRISIKLGEGEGKQSKGILVKKKGFCKIC